MEYKAVDAVAYDFDAETGIFSGYPSVFGVLDDGDWSGVRDIVYPGSFTKTIAENTDRILVCYGHDAFYQLPLGRPVVLEERPRDALPAKIIERWPEATGGLFSRARISDTTLGKDVQILLKDEVLRELSIGYDTIKVDTSDNGTIRHLKELRLWEWSVVPWAMNPAALIVAGMTGNEAKGVIGYIKRPLADEDTAWDAGAEVKKAETTADLRAMHTWYDADETDDDGNLKKSAFKLPHHRGEKPYETIWRGVAAAMGALLGARGGVTIPSGDRKGVYSHLSRHYGEFDKEPPDFKNYKQLGYSDEAILVLCGVEVKMDELAVVEGIIASLAERRKVLVPRRSSGLLLRRLEILETDLSLLE